MDRLHDLGWSRFTHSCAGMGVCFWNLNGKTAPQGAVPFLLVFEKGHHFLRFGLLVPSESDKTASIIGDSKNPEH